VGPDSRVCCVGEICYVLDEEGCGAMGGVFHPAWSNCDENPCVQSGADEPRSPSVTMLRDPAPNPSMGEVLLTYEIANPGWARIDIFDPLGRQVGSVVDSWRQAGRWQAAWNGRDRDGRSVPVGVYSVRLRIGPESQTKRVLLLR
jgi:hypothetical protein